MPPRTRTPVALPPVPPGAPPGQRPAPGPFALAPALAIQGTIDMISPDGRKTYRDATEKLCDPLYDCMCIGLSLFLNSLKRRAQNFGWTSANGILQVTQSVANQRLPKHNLVTNYGEISPAMLLEYDRLYMTRNCRQAQDNHMLFECLMNSLTAAARQKLALREEDYLTDGTYSGPRLLKSIIKASRLDTNASTSMIRSRLGRLAEYMETIENNNIETFNDYVREQVEALTARGEMSTDLLTNLFKGYSAVKDHKFVAYIDEKQSRYDDGQLYTENDLMDLAEARYAILVDKGTWNKPSPEQEQILVMRAQLANMSKTTVPPTKKRTKTGRFEPTPEDGPKRRKWETQPEWKEKNLKPKDVNKRKWWLNRPWFFCCKDNKGHCERWVQHEPSACNGKPRVRPEARPDSNGNPEKVVIKTEGGPSANTRNKKAALLKAISAELNDDSNTDSDVSQN